MTDGPHGLRKQSGATDHLGLAASVPATCFPPAVGLASSWDAPLAERIGEALGVEAAIEDVAVLLGPGINIKRSPLCGRNFEYMSEDPIVSGVMGAALVRGIQSKAVGASLKHFAANNQETDRVRSSSDVDPRPLREIYLRAFQYVIELLVRLFAHSLPAAEALAWRIHNTGRAVVYTTHKEKAELKREQVLSYGADFRMKESRGPLGCYIEPAEG